MWSRKRLLRSIDVEKVRDAIVSAEQQTSAEIRVAVSGFFWGSVQSAADGAFRRLAMASTEGRNGVLIFVVPARRRFVVLGDEGIHRHFGQPLWDEVARVIGEAFRQGEFTEGLVGGIRVLREKLEVAFPFDPKRDRNELPDEVEIDPKPGGA
jgi:uncharacterized membrane protein